MLVAKQRIEEDEIAYEGVWKLASEMDKGPDDEQVAGARRPPRGFNGVHGGL
jgi:hypothetical protein